MKMRKKITIINSNRKTSLQKRERTIISRSMLSKNKTFSKLH